MTFAYMKHLWQAGKKKEAFDTLSHFVTLQTRLGYSHASNVLTQEMTEDTAQNDKMLARSVDQG